MLNRIKDNQTISFSRTRGVGRKASGKSKTGSLLLLTIIPFSIARQTDSSASIAIFNYEEFFQDVFTKEEEGTTAPRNGWRN
jgi:hypothetical protein